MANTRRNQDNDNTDEDTVAEGARSTYRSAKSTARNAKEGIEDMMSDSASSAEELARQAGQVLRQAYQEGQAKVGESAERAREVVQNRPLTTLVGAFVVGAVASMLLRRH